jgi:hypothetical protein
MNMADQSTLGRHTEVAPDKITAELSTRMTTTEHSSRLSLAMNMAERELGAFISAVTNLYGSEQARISAEDWLEELDSMDTLANCTTREWRLITIAAAARLASRLSEIGCLPTAETCSCKQKSTVPSVDQ